MYNTCIFWSQNNWRWILHNLNLKKNTSFPLLELHCLPLQFTIILTPSLTQQKYITTRQISQTLNSQHSDTLTYPVTIICTGLDCALHWPLISTQTPAQTSTQTATQTSTQTATTTPAETVDWKKHDINILFPNLVIFTVQWDFCSGNWASVTFDSIWQRVCTFKENIYCIFLREKLCRITFILCPKAGLEKIFIAYL